MEAWSSKNSKQKGGCERENESVRGELGEKISLIAGQQRVRDQDPPFGEIGL